MQITNTDKSFSALYSRALIPADKNTDTFKLSVWVRGKGAFRIGFYTYAKDRKYVSSYMEPATVIDSGEWVKKDYTIPASKLDGDVGNVRIAIEVNPGRSLFRRFQRSQGNGTAEKVTAPQAISAETVFPRHERFCGNPVF